MRSERAVGWGSLVQKELWRLFQRLLALFGLKREPFIAEEEEDIGTVVSVIHQHVSAENRSGADASGSRWQTRESTFVVEPYTAGEDVSLFQRLGALVDRHLAGEVAALTAHCREQGVVRVVAEGPLSGDTGTVLRLLFGVDGGCCGSGQVPADAIPGLLLRAPEGYANAWSSAASNQMATAEADVIIHVRSAAAFLGAASPACPWAEELTPDKRHFVVCVHASEASVVGRQYSIPDRLHKEFPESCAADASHGAPVVDTLQQVAVCESCEWQVSLRLDVNPLAQLCDDIAGTLSEDKVLAWRRVQMVDWKERDDWARAELSTALQLLLAESKEEGLLDIAAQALARILGRYGMACLSKVGTSSLFRSSIMRQALELVNVNHSGAALGAILLFVFKIVRAKAASPCVMRASHMKRIDVTERALALQMRGVGSVVDSVFPLTL